MNILTCSKIELGKILANKGTLEFRNLFGICRENGWKKVYFSELIIFLGGSLLMIHKTCWLATNGVFVLRAF